MSHRRDLIGEKVRDLLVAASTAAGTRVQLNRFTTLRNTQLPAIAVYALSESVDPESATTAPRELTRRLELAIDGVVAAETEPDSRMNDLAAQIEAAMHADPYLDGVAFDSILVDSILDVQTVGDRLVGHLAMSYEVTYHTLAPEPPADEDLDDFQTAGVTHKTGGVGQAAADDAEDLVVVQEEEEEP